MEFIKSYVDFVNEAYMSKHGNLRVEERIMSLNNIQLSPDQVREIKAMGLEPTAIKDQLISAVKDAFNKRLDAVLATDYPDGVRGVPAIALKLTISGITEYVKLVVTSGIYHRNRKTKEEERVGEKTFAGELVYFSVTDNKIATVMVYDHTKTTRDIKLEMEDHFARKGNEKSVTVFEFKDDNVLELEIVDGEVVKRQRGVGSFIDYAKDQQWQLAPGRQLKVWIPFAKDFVDATIERIENPGYSETKQELIWAAGEKNITIAIKITHNDREMKINKKLWIDDIVYLPIGESDEMIRCKIVSPGYIFDKRQANPVSIKFRALQ